MAQARKLAPNLFTLYFKHSKFDSVNGDMGPKFISGLQSAACREIHSFYPLDKILLSLVKQPLLGKCGRCRCGAGAPTRVG